MRIAQTIALILAVVFVLAVDASAQSDRAYDLIRNEVERIDDREKSYTVSTKRLPNVSAHGTDATYYSSGRDVRKIVAKVSGDTYNADVEMYYKDGKLIYAVQMLNRYADGSSHASPRVAQSIESRLYFSEERLFRLQRKRTRMNNIGERPAEKEVEVADLSDLAKAAFTQ